MLIILSALSYPRSTTTIPSSSIILAFFSSISLHLTEISIKPVQSSKALFSISVTESGITMLVRFLQPLKAYPPIFVTDFPILTLVRPLHHWKAILPISVTVSGITILVRLAQRSKRPELISVNDLPISMPTRPLSLKPYAAISVTESGITMLFKFLHTQFVAIADNQSIASDMVEKC